LKAQKNYGKYNRKERLLLKKKKQEIGTPNRSSIIARDSILGTTKL